MQLTNPVNTFVGELVQEFGQIPEARKELLKKMADYAREKRVGGEPVQFNFICTHNSRRSHIAQLWAQAAAACYNIPAVRCYSGGTEATAFNPLAVRAMQKAGFEIKIIEEGNNPVYEAGYAPGAAAVKVWSKRFDDSANPASDFCAVMTCSDADGNCPFIPGAELRLGVTYEDPKHFDGTPQETEKYNERVRQIGREMLYAFSQV